MIKRPVFFSHHTEQIAWPSARGKVGRRYATPTFPELEPVTIDWCDNVGVHRLRHGLNMHCDKTGQLLSVGARKETKKDGNLDQVLPRSDTATSPTVHSMYKIHSFIPETLHVYNTQSGASSLTIISFFLPFSFSKKKKVTVHRTKELIPRPTRKKKNLQGQKKPTNRPKRVQSHVCAVHFLENVRPHTSHCHRNKPKWTVSTCLIKLPRCIGGA